jgi:hypothetical protein
MGDAGLAGDAFPDGPLVPHVEAGEDAIRHPGGFGEAVSRGGSGRADEDEDRVWPSAVPAGGPFSCFPTPVRDGTAKIATEDP